MRVFPLLLSGLLSAPLRASAEPPIDVAPKGRSSTCDSAAPGYECFSKHDLWEGAVRWQAKAKDARLERDAAQVRLGACEEKLATRTSTAIRNLVVPPAPQAEGHSTTVVVLASGLALVAGIVIGALVIARDDPSTVVVR